MGYDYNGYILILNFIIYLSYQKHKYEKNI